MADGGRVNHRMNHRMKFNNVSRSTFIHVGNGLEKYYLFRDEIRVIFGLVIPVPTRG